MAYEMQAVIAGIHLLAKVAADEPNMHVVALSQGLALAPMSDVLHDLLSVTDGDRLGFWKLPGGFGATLAAWSGVGPVAYVEAEYFGGIGEQRAVVWDHGELVLGPLSCGGTEPVPVNGSPVSQALRRLGATSSGNVDEFAAVGMRRHRHIEQWLDELPVPIEPHRD
jgi:hypothetical protein